MKTDVVDPFNQDVAVHGAYECTNEQRLSTRFANQRIADMVTAMVSFAGKRVIDIGCGDGVYTARLSTETTAASVLGIDPASKAIERASTEYAGIGNLCFRACVSADLLREGAHFDIAVLRGVIHHVGDPQSEIATAIKLADMVVIDEPNGWNFILKILEKVSPYHRRHAEQSFRLGTLRRWIAQGHGDVRRAVYFGLVPFFCPDWLARACRFLEPFVERVPLVRVLACGHVIVVVARRP